MLLLAVQGWAWWAIAAGRTSTSRVLVFYVLHPRETWRAWRHRHTPPAPRRAPLPALRLDATEEP